LSNHANDFFGRLLFFFLSLSFSRLLDLCRVALVAVDDVLHDVLDVTVRVTPMRFSSQLNPSLGLSPSIRLSRSFAVNRSPGAFGSLATGSSHIASTSSCPRDQIYLCSKSRAIKEKGKNGAVGLSSLRVSEHEVYSRRSYRRADYLARFISQ